MLLSTVKRYMKDPVRIYFGLLQILVQFLDKLKARDFNVTSLSTYDFPTLFTTLPNTLIEDKLIDLIERIFNSGDSPYLARFSTSEKPKKNIMHGLVKMYVMR